MIGAIGVQELIAKHYSYVWLAEAMMTNVLHKRKMTLTKNRSYQSAGLVSTATFGNFLTVRSAD